MEKQTKNKGTVPFFPHHLLSEASLAFAFLGVILVLAGLFEAELGPPANALQTPIHILPEWYFLWLFGLLRLVPQTVGLLIPVLLIGGLFLLPWLDRKKETSANRIILLITGLILVGLVILSVVARLPW
ncbi:MAG: cytochrome b subunit of the bc complex [Peptococcaceae bacterium]|nr:cytochrome b subunit of the bc complex [Peptococcaceae bacterium]MDR2737301.1 cytochrome b subunit of the bc complex [Gracilibacteraceae bacterium]